MKKCISIKDEEVLKKLDEVPNKSDYICNLIKKDIHQTDYFNALWYNLFLALLNYYYYDI